MTEPQTLRDLAGAYLVEQCSVIIDAEQPLRQREPVIHPTRVAVRRLRSTLRTYPELFDVPRAGRLEDELVWWAGLLGAIRDLDILTARLTGQLAELPPDLVVGPVERQLDVELTVRRKAGWDAVHEALDDDRYRELVAELGRWRSDPPFTPDAGRPASAVDTFVKRANKKVEKRLRRAVKAHQEGSDEADELMHRARKAGKRHRYCVELAAPVWGGRADKIVSARKDLQDVLGEHQDSIVSAAFLKEQGVTMGIRSGHNGFTYGLLYARELARKDAVGDRLKPFV